MRFPDIKFLSAKVDKIPSEPPPRTHRYQVTCKERRIVTALLAGCDVDVEQRRTTYQKRSLKILAKLSYFRSEHGEETSSRSIACITERELVRMELGG